MAGTLIWTRSLALAGHLVRHNRPDRACLLNLGTVFDFSDPENLMRIDLLRRVGRAVLLFFNLFVGDLHRRASFRRTFLWTVVVGLEGFANVVGRIAAWAGLF
jgi:hypothetical protein